MIDKMTRVVCPHCGDVTDQAVMLPEFTCGQCDRSFSTVQRQKVGDETPLYHIKVGELTQEQRDQKWAPQMTISIWRETEGDA